MGITISTQSTRGGVVQSGRVEQNNLANNMGGPAGLSPEGQAPGRLKLAGNVPASLEHGGSSGGGGDRPMGGASTGGQSIYGEPGSPAQSWWGWATGNGGKTDVVFDRQKGGS